MTTKITMTFLAAVLCALASAQAIRLPSPDLPTGYNYKKPLSAKQIVAVKDEMLLKEIDFLNTWIARGKRDVQVARTGSPEKATAQKKLQAYEKALSLRQQDAGNTAKAPQKAKLQSAKSNFARWRTELRRRIGVKETEVKRLQGRTGGSVQPTIRELKIEIAELQGYEKSLMSMEKTAGALIAKS